MAKGSHISCHLFLNKCHQKGIFLQCKLCMLRKPHLWQQNSLKGLTNSLGGWLILLGCRRCRFQGLLFDPFAFQSNNDHIHVFSLLIYYCPNICKKSEFVHLELVVESGEQNAFYALDQPKNEWIWTFQEILKVP